MANSSKQDLQIIRDFLSTLNETQRANLQRKAQSGKLVFGKWVQKNGELGVCLTVALLPGDEQDKFPEWSGEGTTEYANYDYEALCRKVADLLKMEHLHLRSIVEAWDRLRSYFDIEYSKAIVSALANGDFDLKEVK